MLKKGRKQQIFIAYSPAGFQHNFMESVQRFKIIHNPNNRLDGFIGAIANDKFYIYFTTIVFWGMSDVLSGSIMPCVNGFMLSCRFHKTFYTVWINLVSAAFFTGFFAELLFLIGLGVWPPYSPFAVAAAAVAAVWFFVFWKPAHYKKLILEELDKICGGKLLEDGEREK